MTHNAGIFGNDTDGWTPDCTCGATWTPNLPQPKEDALDAANFHRIMQQR